MKLFNFKLPRSLKRQNKNPASEEETLLMTFSSAGSILQVIGGLTSAGIVYSLFARAMPAILPGWARILLAILLTAGSITFMLSITRKVFPSVLDMTGRWRRLSLAGRFYAIFAGFFCLGLLFLNGLTSYESRNIFADILVEEPEYASTSTQVAEYMATLNTFQQKYMDKIFEAEQSEAERVAVAEAQREARIQSAIDSRGKNVGDAYRKTQSEYTTKLLKKALDKAVEEGNALVERERAYRSTLVLERDSVLAFYKSAVDDGVATINSSNEELSQRFLKEQKKVATYAGWGGLVAVILEFCLYILMAIFRAHTGLKLQSKRASPPFMHAVMQLFSRAERSTARRLYKYAEATEAVRTEGQSYGKRTHSTFNQDGNVSNRNRTKDKRTGKRTKRTNGLRSVLGGILGGTDTDTNRTDNRTLKDNRTKNPKRPTTLATKTHGRGEGGGLKRLPDPPSSDFRNSNSDDIDLILGGADFTSDAADLLGISPEDNLLVMEDLMGVDRDPGLALAEGQPGGEFGVPPITNKGRMCTYSGCTKGPNGTRASLEGKRSNANYCSPTCKAADHRKNKS